MKRAYTTFIGIDLGGGRGKTTAVALIEAKGESGEAVVHNVAPRHRDSSSEEPWTDDALLGLIESVENPCVAIDAPLTAPACVRCPLPECPGQSNCVDETTVWLEGRGAELVREVRGDSQAVLGTFSTNLSSASSGFSESPGSSSRLYPYVHRAAEIELHHGRNVFPKGLIGQSAGPVANRALHLVRRLAPLGLTLHDNLIEVSPRATVTALFGEELGKGYKRDADPWQTRAKILENIGVELRFSPRSRLSREQCLANDNCFEALLSAFTAYLYARDGWSVPDDGPFAEDGWIFAPPRSN